MRRYSVREAPIEFEARKEITYNPAFAKSALYEIRNSIFQRMSEISRVGGSDSYQNAVAGKDQGVDLLGSTMTSFLGRKALGELLTMARVGIFVDMPALSGITIADNLGKRPYLYIYKAEDIRTWRFDEYDSQSEFSSLLLRDYIFEFDEERGLPIGERVRYRHLFVSDEDNKVHCQFYGETGNPVAANQGFQVPVPSQVKEPESEWGVEEEVILNIDRIPFVVLELSDSLLTDVANYQIALLNLASSDLSYVLQANFPFYTEQFEPRAGSQFVKSGVNDSAEQIAVGTSKGRRYPKGLERPMFIAPPTDPLQASMKKQEQMKAEIRQLVHLSVANLQPRDASAESKGMDNQGLESGLSYIGLELEHAERRIADYWAMYERGNAATVRYPEKYSLRTEEDRRAEAKELTDLLSTVPSETYRKEVCWRIVEVMLGNKLSTERLDAIRKEIDNAVGITAAVDVIAKHVEIGILDLELASKLCGYPSDTVAKAADDHAERLARITAAQAPPNMAARGVSDLDAAPAGGGSAEKVVSKDTTEDGVVSDKVRGAADE